MKIGAFFLLLFVFVHGAHGNEKKIVALTFDDGPKPFVLYGFEKETRKPKGSGLLRVLDAYRVKATFFVQGWKLSWQDREMLNAARDVFNRGHEIENHTRSHGPMLKWEEMRGTTYVMNDVKDGADAIQKITGKRPVFIRPPEWSIDLRLKELIESRGYRVVTKSQKGIRILPVFADVDSEDWAYYEKNPKKRPRCAQENPEKQWRECLVKETLKKIESREQDGVYSHILVFHELPLTAEAMYGIIEQLKIKGYEFVTLEDYFKRIENAKEAR